MVNVQINVHNTPLQAQVVGTQPGDEELERIVGGSTYLGVQPTKSGKYEAYYYESQSGKKVRCGIHLSALEGARARRKRLMEAPEPTSKTSAGKKSKAPAGGKMVSDMCHLRLTPTCSTGRRLTRTPVLTLALTLSSGQMCSP